MEEPVRQCEHCQKILVRREKEKPVRFRTRRFCCTRCFYHHRSGLTYGLLRNCQYCGQLLVQHQKESPSAFERRLSCDKACANRFKNDLVRGKPNPKLQGSNNGMWGKTHTAEAREIQRQSALAHPLSKEKRQEMALNQIGRKHRQKTKDKMSDSRILWWSKQPEETKDQLRQSFIENLPARPRFRKTGIERRIAKELDTLGIQYLWNTPLLGKFNVDFLLEEYRVVIECDGEYWHGLPEMMARDVIKDKEIPEAGYTLIRLEERDINHNLDDCAQRIVDALC